MAKCAFIASGGGMKAYAFHVGVLRALEYSGFRRVMWNDPPLSDVSNDENTFNIGTYVGSSAGACIAGAAIFAENIDEMEAVIGLRKYHGPVIGKKTLLRKPRLWPPWKISGLLDIRGMQEFFRRSFYENDFTKLTPEVFIVATQLNGGRKVIFGPRDSGANNDYHPEFAYYNNIPMNHAVAASMSVPGLFEPYSIVNPSSGERIHYIDGEIRETLSAHIAQDAGVELAIVSNTWVPSSYLPEVGSIHSRGIYAVLLQALNQCMGQKVVSFRNNSERKALAIDYIRFKAKNEGLSEEKVTEVVKGLAMMLQYSPMDEIVIEPSPTDDNFNRISPWTFKQSELQLVVDTGYRRAIQAISVWQETQPPRDSH